MVEWRYEAGIGEERAALIDADGSVLEAFIEPDTPRLRTDSVVEGTFAKTPDRRGIVTVGAHEALIANPPKVWTEGERVCIRIVREALPERGDVKRAVAVATDEAPREAPSLLARIEATGVAIQTQARFGPSILADTDWGDLIATATGAPVDFDVGRLHVEPTRALTVIDVDGWGDVAVLAVRSAAVAARTIRRLGIAGQIVIDFPSVDAATRAAATAAFDAELPKPFERTALGGFGLLQVVRPRVRPSLIELVRLDPTGFWARIALDGARALQPGAHRLVVSPAVADWLEARHDLLAVLGRHLGGIVRLRSEATSPNWTWYAEPIR